MTTTPVCGNAGCPVPPPNQQMYCTLDCATEAAYPPLPDDFTGPACAGVITPTAFPRTGH